MIEEQAIVVEINGKKISVETDDPSNCGHCSAKSGCGTSLLGEFFSRNRKQLIVETEMSLAVGDKVILGLSSDALLQGSVIIYAIPLIMMLALPVAMSYFYASESVSIFSGAIGLAAGLIYVKYFSIIANGSERFRPVVLRRVN